MASDPDVIAWKYANGLFKDAEPSAAAKAMLAPAASSVERVKQMVGGYWVGGRVTLTSDAVSFAPNAVNVAAHAGNVAKSLPLADVASVEDRFGWLTRIVDVHSRSGDTLTFRCFGAPAFAEKIRQAARSAAT